jgi:hypothetical protein
VGAAEGVVKEPLGIEYWQRLPAERLAEGIDRDLRGPGTVGMAAHAVDGHQQHGGAVADHGDAVLVLMAAADEADVGNFDAHGNDREIGGGSGLQ